MMKNILLLVLCSFFAVSTFVGCTKHNTSQDTGVVEITDELFGGYNFTPTYAEEYQQTFYKQVSSELSKYRFVLWGYFGYNEDEPAMISIHKIEVFDEDDTPVQTIDSINSLMRGHPLSDTDFSFDDWNQDGYMDISLARHPSGSMGNRPTCFWFWDTESGQFVANEQLDEISEGCHVTLEDDHRISAMTKFNIQTSYRNYYQFEAGELILVEEQTLSNGQPVTTSVTEAYAQTFHHMITPDFPEFTFVLHGHYTNKVDETTQISIREIEVFDADNTIIQTIENIHTAIPRNTLSDTDFSFDDWNQDGYVDISLFCFPGGTLGNRPTHFWFWDNEAKQFIANENLSELSKHYHIALENNNRICASATGGYPIYHQRYYQFEADRLILVEEQTLTYDH